MTFLLWCSAAEYISSYTRKGARNRRQLNISVAYLSERTNRNPAYCKATRGYGELKQEIAVLTGAGEAQP